MVETTDATSLPKSSTICSHHIIVFTRFPEPGKTKTRLIPALGAEGAARVQTQMTEHTLATIQAFKRTQHSSHNAVSVDVRFAGGTAARMQQWLGLQWAYTPQGEGDLGDRLLRAFDDAFERGARFVLAIGIDCPDITVDSLTEAFHHLASAELVIGPADDGGYYLIGLSKLVPDCFHSIAWGTDTVCQTTLDIAAQLNLTVEKLQVLSDVDRPDDLPIWERALATSPLHTDYGLSILIPTLNEGQRIGKLLDSLVSHQGKASTATEIIVVDGGSTDDTLTTACSYPVHVIRSEPGRARQMNTAAQKARGKILLFLHADTMLPKELYAPIAETLAQPNVVAGAFELAIQGQNPALRVVEWGVRWRSHLFQLPYGDQGLFMTREVFESIG
ncbi:MAG: TIGR04282 family arsenosugar biosynthesis glycosyltransferase, partial [Leptolyngbyaceae bacterium]|nr:TIGR04282 family arsenosugar biosynthesis glycosyltransferase [Leptolyngbyaceae bacterium]